MFSGDFILSKLAVVLLSAMRVASCYTDYGRTATFTGCPGSYDLYALCKV
jgi:hypothetical protein